MPPRKFRLPHPEPTDALTYARFTGVSTFLRLPHITEPEELEVALVGVPFDGGTTYRPGPRFGPRHIREQSAIIRPWNPVLNVNPFRKRRTGDYGDLSVNPLSIEDTFRRIETGIAPLLTAGARCVCVGGDHSVSLPLLRAVAKKHGPVSLIQFDAHNDLWDEYFGSKYSHGTPFRRAFEEGLLRDGEVLQVGLRGQVYGKEDFDFARKHKVKMVTSEEFHSQGIAPVEKLLRTFRNKSVYVTLDIDVVDPAYAPGTGTPQVGGLTSVQILELVRALGGLQIVGCDLVEVSPPYDTGEITSLLAANLLFELLCVL
ncbi:MAG TPA: agmatinase [Candidatus Dormibacteraeota bacterium]|nr:agmatinase [Candidatus Dormibacteraeota bacterium]